MNIKIQSIHFDADQKLIKFIEEKLKKVEKFYDNILKIEVFLKLANEHATDNKTVDIRIEIPGSEFFASKTGKKFEEAVVLCIDALKIQLTKYKEKIRGK